MAELYKAEDSVMMTVKDLIGKYHPRLVPIIDEIAVVFKEKASEVGDVTIIGKTSKAPPLLSVLGDVKYKFVITLAQNEWTSMDDKARLALLDHHLCACGVEEDNSGSVSKCYIRLPDVSFFKEEVERHGLWRTSEAPPTPVLLQELFGTATP